MLDDIPGIGDTRRRALMKHFKSIEAVQAASEEELRPGSGHEPGRGGERVPVLPEEKDDIPIEVVEETGNM